MLVGPLIAELLATMQAAFIALGSKEIKDTSQIMPHCLEEFTKQIGDERREGGIK